MRLLLCSVLSFISILSGAQDTFNSLKLKNICQQLEKKAMLPGTKQSGIFQATLDGKSIPCILLRDKQNRISHVGIRLFSRFDSLPYPAEMLQFLERITLESALAQPVENLEKKLTEDGIFFYYNDAELGSFTFPGFASVLELFGHDFDFSMRTDSLMVAAVFKGEHGNSFRMLFPARNTLIMGMDKKELDQAISEALPVHRKKAAVVFHPSTDSLTPSPRDYQTSLTREFFPGITTRKYYEEKAHGRQVPVFNPEHPAESFANLFLLEIQGEMKRQVAITHVVYGMDKKEYTIELADLRDFFRDQYEWYFGIEDSKSDNLTGTIIISQPGRHFIHLLYVKTQKDVLFNPAIPVIAVLYTNIPTDNIKNLFAEYSATGGQIKTKQK